MVYFKKGMYLGLKLSHGNREESTVQPLEYDSLYFAFCLKVCGWIMCMGGGGGDWWKSHMTAFKCDKVLRKCFLLFIMYIVLFC